MRKSSKPPLNEVTEVASAGESHDFSIVPSQESLLNTDHPADSERVTQPSAHAPLRYSARWRFAEWALFVVWVAGALMTMYPQLRRALGLDPGFFTSYGADLTQPPFMYIVMRRGKVIRWARWFGRSPERAAFSIFAVGVATELSQIYWPDGFFRGTFDPLDIVAYAIGLIICCVIDRYQLQTSSPRAPNADRV